MMKYSQKVLLLAFIILACTNCISMFNLIPLPKTNGAMCMDGSPAGLYLFRPDDNAVPNKLMIYFQDIWQGWCARDNLNDSIKHCYKYITESNFIDSGSSKNWENSYTVLNGILSSNSIFGAWSKVNVKSCDGGSYFSDSNVTIKNKTMNFRGSRNVIQTINYLNKNNLLANSEEVLIVGAGNGGLAALAWADYIKAYTKGKVRVMVDAGVWENQLFQKTKTPLFQNRIKMLDKLFLNGKDFPNTKCQSANKDNIHKCFYASQLTKYIDSDIKIMFLQSYYDSWQAIQILGLSCSEQFGSLSECTAEHRLEIQDYHKKISTSLQQLVKLPNVGAFGIACVGHFFTNGKWDNTDFSVPMNSNNTAQDIVQKWVNSKSSTDSFKFLDSAQWPNNKPCSRQVKNPNLITQ